MDRIIRSDASCYFECLSHKETLLLILDYIIFEIHTPLPEKGDLGRLGRIAHSLGSALFNIESDLSTYQNNVLYWNY